MADTNQHYKYHVGDDINDFYEIGKELGRGAFSVVKLGTRKSDGKQVAIKIMSRPTDQDDRKNHIINIEIGILKRVNHSNVISMYEVFETDTEIMIVLQLITGGELFEQIVELSFYSEKDAARVIRQILLGIKALHDSNVVHRDLKPENLLLSEKSMDADVVITDFGLSAILDPEPLVYDAVGTPSYLAPEVLATLDTNAGYGKEVDLWGVGVILYILLCGFPPFYGEDEDEIYDKIEVGEYNFPSPYWDPISQEAKELITRFLTLDPVQRITCEEALNHPWIRGDAVSEAVLEGTVKELAKFNARRKFKGAVKGLMAAARMSNAFTKLKNSQELEKSKKRGMLNKSRQ